MNPAPMRPLIHDNSAAREDDIHYREQRLRDYKHFSRRETVIYPEKMVLAIQIMRTVFCTAALLVSLCAPMQYGKTSVIAGIAYLALAAPQNEQRRVGLGDEPRVRQVVVITGLSDKEWQRQTAERFECFGTGNHSGITVLHRGQLKKNLPLFKELKDAIVIIDECHYGSGKKQIIHNVLCVAGLLDQDNLCNRNVRIVQVSATPDSTLVWPQGWAAGLHKTIVANWNVPGYISPQTILDDNRVRRPMDLTNPDNARKALKPFVNDDCTVRKSGIIFVRAPKGKFEAVIKNFQSLQHEFRTLEVTAHNCKTDTHAKVDKLTRDGPGESTIHVVIVNDFYRAAKTFASYKHILALHEPVIRGKTSTATVTQSFLGRMCGYHGNRWALVHTCRASVVEYIACVKAGFDYEALEDYNSSTLVCKKGTIVKCRQAYSSGIAAGDSVPAPPRHIDEGKREVELTVRDAWKLVLRIKGVPQTEANIDKMINRKRSAIKDVVGDDGRTFKSTTRVDRIFKLKRRITKADIDRMSLTEGTHGKTANKYLIVPYYDNDASDTVRYMVQWRARTFQE